MNIFGELRKRILFCFLPFFRFLLFNISVSFGVGIFLSTNLSFYQSILFILFLYLGIAIFIRSKYLQTLFVSLLFVVIGIARTAIFEMRLENSILRYNGEYVEIYGEIVKEVEAKDRFVKIVIKPKLLICNKEEVNMEGSYGQVLIQGNSFDEFFYGDLVFVKGKLETPPEFEDFSYKEYLNSQGIVSLLKFDDVKRLDRENGKNLLIYIKELKYAITKKLEKLLPSPHSNLLSGIVYGAKSTMPEDFSHQLSVTGTTHIIAVSGYNITVLVSSLGVFSYIFGRKRLYAISVIFLFLYMFFVGVDNIPVVRATIMGISFIVSKLLGRKGSFNVMFPFVIAILLFFNPLSYKLISFQLSFLSTLGLVILSNIIQAELYILPSFARENVASTLAAIFFTMPVTLMNFNKVSIISPLANFFILPAVPFITIGGFFYIFIVVFFFNISKNLAYFFWFILEYVIKVEGVLSKLDIAMITLNKDISNQISILLYIILFISCVEITYKKSAKNF